MSIVPALTAPRKARKLTSAETVTRSGLRVLVVRKPAVPLVEVRLRIPFQGTRAAHPARAALLADTLLTGAGGRGRIQLAEDVQALGGDLNVGVDADRLIFSGNALAANTRRLLEHIARVLVAAEFPRQEVAIERDRLVERLSIARSRAGVIAAEALGVRMWGTHPYARDLPSPDAVQAVTPAALRALHEDRVRPRGATLVIVGDVSPARVLDQVAEVLQGWRGRPGAVSVPRLPDVVPGDTVIVDRPGSVQSSLRMGAMVVPRTHRDYPALQLANLIFGGYISSRWAGNIREDKGYTYSPHSRIDHMQLGSALMLDADVATEVTAPALLETRYELGRIASLPVTEQEVESARQYAIGTLALSTATQAGLASTLSALSAFGFGLEWIAEHPARLGQVGVAEVSAAAHSYLAPSRLVQIVVGDAATITDPIAALGPITAAPTGGGAIAGDG